MANHYLFDSSLFYSSNRYLISYKIEDPAIQSQFERLIEEIGFRIVLKSPISILLAERDNGPFNLQKCKRFRELRFHSSDVIELTTTRRGALQFVRLKKRGNKTISLIEYRNVLSQNRTHQNI